MDADASTPKGVVPAKEANASATTNVEVYGCPLVIALAPDTPSTILGAPAWLTFRITTTCSKTLAVLDGGDYRNALGRPDSFKVTVTDATGAVVTPVEVGPGFGGLVGPQPLVRGASFEKRFLLSHWAAVTAAGTYTVTIEKELLIGDRSTPKTDDKTKVQAKVSATVELRSESKEALGAIIDAVGKRALSEGDEADEAIRALLSINDGRVVPYFISLISGKRTSERIYGVWGLGRFDTDEALAALEKTMAGKDDALAIAAAQTIATNKNKRAWDVLWAARASKNDNVRLTVLHALAAKKGLPDQKQRIQSFSKDKAPLVAQEAARYLKELFP